MKKNIFLIIDFDSTIISCETLDELSNLSLQNDLKKINQIKNITNKAMNGEIDFVEALNNRLDILDVNQKNVLASIELIKNNITNTFFENKDFIKKNSEKIYIVSGGFFEFIEPVATILGIKSNHIFCNSFIENETHYELNEKNIMAKNNGKIEVVKKLGLDGTIIVIGDGYTDYEIKKYGYADIFIAYTEHVNRVSVSKLSDYKSNSFSEIINYINSL